MKPHAQPPVPTVSDATAQLPNSAKRPKWRVFSASLIVSLLLAFVGGLAFVLFRASAAAPGLTITISTNDTVLLTVTNALVNEAYEIYATNSVSDNMAWSLSITGALGVSNFSVSTWPATRMFFKARASNDWDSDGIPNFKDANPNNTNIGVLSVTIDSPANGSTIQ
jgi:hypothetical protein